MACHAFLPPCDRLLSVWYRSTTGEAATAGKNNLTTESAPNNITLEISKRHLVSMPTNLNLADAQERYARQNRSRPVVRTTAVDMQRGNAHDKANAILCALCLRTLQRSSRRGLGDARRSNHPFEERMGCSRTPNAERCPPTPPCQQVLPPPSVRTAAVQAG